MIASINQKVYPNTLLVILNPDSAEQQSETKGKITRIFDNENKPLGYNFFEIDSVLDLKDAKDGQIKLNHAQVSKLNEYLAATGFEGELPNDEQPTLVYAYVKTSVAHPDSDHLHVTTLDIGQDEDVQIVCGAPNIAAGQMVVAALPGTMMPDGSLIWPGALRGVDSYGMITSARELGLAHAPQQRGILVLPADFKVGHELEAEKVDQLLAEGAI